MGRKTNYELEIEKIQSIGRKMCPTYIPGRDDKKTRLAANKRESAESQARIMSKYGKPCPKQTVKVVGPGLIIRDF